MNSNRRIFIKQIGMTALGASMLSVLPELKGQPMMASGLPRSSPEKQGASSSGLSTFLDAIEKSKIEFHSVMVLRHGNVIAEGWWNPYSPTLKHTLYSLSKSFTSTAVGFAITENHFTLEDPVISFFPDDLPSEVSDNLKAMKVKHLLTMSTGHATDTNGRMRNTGKETWVKGFLSLPVEKEPGTFFLYNTGATYMLSAIVQKKTGKPLIQYLEPRLFAPLGIVNPDWESDPNGINTGGYGLRVKTEDIARFGQLYLQKGQWNGKQLIPSAWIEDATSSHIQSNPSTVRRPKEQDDWAQGYGYQFWRCRFGAYRGDGAFGQFCIVNPELDAVVVITGESFDLQGSMNLVWNNVWPAMSKSDPGIQNQKTLAEKLKGLSWQPPQGSKTSSLTAGINAKSFILESNEFNATSISFSFTEGQCQFKLKGEKSEVQLTANFNGWKINDRFRTQQLFPLMGRPEVSTPIAAAVTWTDDHTLVMALRYTEFAHSDTITFSFEEKKVTLSFLNSVAKGNPQNEERRKPIHGVMA